MTPCALLFVSLWLHGPAPMTQDDALLKQAREIHKRAIVIDLHSDTTERLLDEKIDWSKRLPEGHMDIPRMKEGGFGRGVLFHLGGAEVCAALSGAGARRD